VERWRHYRPCSSWSKLDLIGLKQIRRKIDRMLTHDDGERLVADSRNPSMHACYFPPLLNEAGSWGFS
jgi:hypothetical protein